MDKYRRKLLFTASNRPYITFKTTGVKGEELLEIIKILLQDVKKLQEGFIIYYNKGSGILCRHKTAKDKTNKRNQFFN